jgi:dTDP-4-amino-4,6-dideoxygalactose transaminase
MHHGFNLGYKKMIRVSKSTISSKEIKAVSEVLKKEYLGMGHQVQKFEKNIEKFLKNKCVCVSSGTAALHLACQSIGLSKGDEVLVQSITYIGSFQAISATGAKPVACEVNPLTLTIDTNDLIKKINFKTKAIMPVHFAGNPGELTKIYSIAKKYKLRVIEDAAHAFGSYYKKYKIGQMGDIVCFSFDGIKNITSGEGGCIVSKDEKVINYAKDARLLGVHNDSTKRYKNMRSWELTVSSQGWRYHMSNIMAAIGIEQLKKFPTAAKKRQKFAKLYSKKLRDNTNLSILPSNYDLVVPHIYPVIFTNRELRNKYKKKLEVNNVQTGIHYKPNHQLKFYENKKNKLPISDNLYERILTLPLHLDLTSKQINFICSLLKNE